jgi:hypothetical protein
MIKKFKHYIESIHTIITTEDVEDHFLKLKEKYDCKVEIDSETIMVKKPNTINVIIYNVPANLTIEEIEDEIKQSTRRVVDMFPSITAKIERFDLHKGPMKVLNKKKYKYFYIIRISKKKK